MFEIRNWPAQSEGLREMQAHILAILAILTAVCLSDGFCCLVGATFSVGQAIKTKTQGFGVLGCSAEWPVIK